MLIVNRSEYPTSVVEPLLRYALLDLEMPDSLTVEVGDLAKEGSPAQVEIELPRVRVGDESPRLLLALASPVQYPALVSPGEVPASDWHEALIAVAAWGGRAVWRLGRYGTPPESVEAVQDMGHFARWKLMHYRKLREHIKLWGWVPVGHDCFEK